MIKRLLLSLSFATLLVPTIVVAEGLPEPLTGSLTITNSESVFHAGMGANQVIFNPNSNLDLGFVHTPNWKPGDATLLNSVERCIAAIGTDPFDLSLAPAKCFMLTPMSYNASTLMTSRVFRNGYPHVEIAAILQDKIVSGDVYGLSGTGTNFALYGRNLKHNAQDVSNETWDAGDSYAFNPNAQASFSSLQQEYLTGRIKQLAGEATIITAAALSSNSTWYLQGENIGDSNEKDKAKYPEGKVWLVGNSNCGAIGNAQCLSLATSHTFVGKGTIIIMSPGGGLLYLKNGVSITPAGDNDSLGLIITGKNSDGTVPTGGCCGNMEFRGNNKIQAAVMALGTISQTAVGNIYSIGSFVASDFSFRLKNSVIFEYDNRLSENWPPGFRYFNMPGEKDVTP